jgi:hypothetical protein
MITSGILEGVSPHLFFTGVNVHVLAIIVVIAWKLFNDLAVVGCVSLF